MRIYQGGNFMAVKKTEVTEVKETPAVETKTVPATVKETVKTEVKETAEPAVKTTPAAAEKTVKEEVKDTVKAPAAAKAPAKKPAAKRAAAKKPAAKKTTAKTEAKQEMAAAVILQFGGKEIDTTALTARVKEIWTKELGNKEKDLKDVKLYVKPEEFAAYYVINGNVTGSIEL